MSDETPIFERGDVVFGADPFKGDEVTPVDLISRVQQWPQRLDQ